jgi:VWFA-related protein
MTTGRARLSALCAALLGALILVASAQEPQRQPPFRTGTNIVRVDAYPTRDGRIVEGLTAEDFEVLEDGVVQKISSFEFVRFPQSNPVEERRDPNSQREGFQLAADPSYRVFVIYLDNLHVNFTGSHNVRTPLITFLNRVLGPKDLFGVITTAQSVNDLMLGQKTEFIEEQLTKYWDWGRGARVLEDEQDLMLEACGLSGLIPYRRVNEVFSDLEGLISKLSEVREERKNVVLVSDGWLLPARIPPGMSTGKPMIPQPGVTNAGKITLGARHPGEISAKMCEDLRAELTSIDFQQRMRSLLDLARQSNVTFYSLRPSGLVAAASAMGQNIDRSRLDSLRALSDNTDGIAIVNTNDLTGGARRIADDLAAVYYLGYTPANTKADGRVRRITVRLKKSGETIRARREYRAPSEEEIAAMRAAKGAAEAPPVAPTGADAALSELKRLRPGAAIHTRGSVINEELVLTTELTAPEIEAGRWKSGAEVQVMVSAGSGDPLTTTRVRIEPGGRSAVIRIPVKGAVGPFSASLRARSTAGDDAQDGVTVDRAKDLLGDPLIFRGSTPSNFRPAGSVQFRRTERMQVRWPVQGSIERHEARLLGRDGVPLELTVAASTLEEAGVTYLVADLNLAPLTAGEYLLEMKGEGAGRSATTHLAFRVSR